MRISGLLCISIMLLSLESAFAGDYVPQVQSALEQANQLFNEAKYASARMRFNEALRIEPKCPEAYNGIGLCFSREGDFEQSDSSYLKAIEIDTEHYESLYNLANNFYLEAASADGPKAKQEKFSRSISYYERARQALESKTGKSAGADLLTSMANVYRDRARTFDGTRKTEELHKALDLYKNALDTNPLYPQVKAELGRCLFESSQYSEAEQELRAAIALKPDYSYPYYTLGKLYAQKKELPAALLAFHHSLNCENRDVYKEDTMQEMLALGIPKDNVEHFALGYEYLHASKWESAVNEFMSVSGAPTLSAVALNNAAYAQYRGGKISTALDTLKKAMEESSHGVPELYYNQGQILMQSGRLHEAEQSFKRCLDESKGNHALAHNSLAILAARAGRFKEAESLYSLALLQSGNGLAVAQFNRALVLEKLGRKSDALAGYKKYLESSPSGSNAAAARKRMDALAGQPRKS